LRITAAATAIAADWSLNLTRDQLWNRTTALLAAQEHRYQPLSICTTSSSSGDLVPSFITLTNDLRFAVVQERIANRTIETRR
jgi:hypothetical protein